MNKEQKIIKIPAYIDEVKTTKDHCLRLKIETQELTSEDKALIFNYHEKYGVFMFAEVDVKESELKDLPEVKMEKGQKTPSQRLRDRLFVVWKETGNKEVFDSWYLKELDKIGQYYLDKYVNK